MALREAFKRLEVGKLVFEGAEGPWYLEPPIEKAARIIGIDLRVVPFTWSRDPERDTAAAVDELAKLIRRSYVVARRRARPLVVVAHSWGGVLAVLALARIDRQIEAGDEPVFVTQLTTLGTPISSTGAAGKYAGRTLRNLGFELPTIKPASVGVWNNLWAARDIFSARIDVADKNFQIDALNWPNPDDCSDESRVAPTYALPPALGSVALAKVAADTGKWHQAYFRDVRFGDSTISPLGTCLSETIGDGSRPIRTVVGGDSRSNGNTVVDLLGWPPRFFVETGTYVCSGDCCTYGEWTVEKRVELYGSPSASAPPVAVALPGQRVVATRGQIHGYPIPVKRFDGRVAYVLSYMGSGAMRVLEVPRGDREPSLVEWNPSERPGRYRASGDIRDFRWVKVRTAEDVDGWTKEVSAFHLYDRCGCC